jgi:endonuclease G
MPSSLLRATFALPLLLALVQSGPAAEVDVHLFGGNPSAATADRGKPDNYLVRKRQFTLSYNNSRGIPNWVSWQLNKAWLGKARRGNPFAPDLSLPRGFFTVRPNDYRGAGFDRGHLCPAADRSVSQEDMDATFAMSNMVPQAPDLNRGSWEKLEAYSRDQARDGEEDLYVVAGPLGQGGSGSGGERSFLRGAGGRVTVPAKCWKVVLVVPAGVTDPKKVTAEARVFAVVLPNQQGTRNWRDHAVRVEVVQRLTGYTFFTHLRAEVARELRERGPETRARRTPSTEAKEKTPAKGGGAVVELAEFKAGCVVANRKTKIYHVAGGAGYKAAQKSANAVFFKNADDAERAGYRKAKR